MKLDFSDKAAWIAGGDSMTIGVPLYGTSAFPYKLAALTGLTIRNYGVGGETARTIASRQGGMPMIAQPFTIPSGITAVELSIKSSDGGATAPLLQSSDLEKGVNPCTINGIEGTLSYTNSKYYFTRTTAGTETAVNRPTPIITHWMQTYRNNPMILWIGQNGEADVDEEKLISIYKLMIDYTLAVDKKWICIGLHTGNASTRSTLEKKMTDTFGRHYINIREYLVSYGLSDAGITPTQADTDAIAIGQCPPSLVQSDGVHGTDAFYTIIANLVYLRGQELGYWS
jgi:hypothetical protein